MKLTSERRDELALLLLLENDSRELSDTSMLWLAAGFNNPFPEPPRPVRN